MDKHINWLIAAAALCAMPLASCSNDTDIDIFESLPAESGQGTLAVASSSVNWLEFEWQAVDGVHQYGYKLSTPASNSARTGVTRSTKLRFENLEPSTDYTLAIEAYGSNGNPTCLYAIKTRTDDIRQLATPDASQMSYTVDAGQVTIEWPAVEGADTYDYELSDANGKSIDSGTVSEPSVTFGSLDNGAYVIEISADTESVAFTRSETARYEFEKTRALLHTYQGTYTSSLGANPCALRIYDDGAYVIEAFYGVEGYNLEFSLNAGTITILNAYQQSGKYKYVATGVEGCDTATIYEDPQYCTYTALPTSKRIKLYVYLGDSQEGVYDQFTWKEK